MSFCEELVCPEAVLCKIDGVPRSRGRSGVLQSFCDTMFRGSSVQEGMCSEVVLCRNYGKNEVV